MNDMIDKRAARDWDTINLDEGWQVQYWTTRFGVLQDELKEAVAVVGTNGKEVQKYFGIRGHGRWRVEEKPLDKQGWHAEDNARE